MGDYDDYGDFDDDEGFYEVDEPIDNDFGADDIDDDDLSDFSDITEVIKSDDIVTNNDDSDNDSDSDSDSDSSDSDSSDEMAKKKRKGSKKVEMIFDEGEDVITFKKKDIYSGLLKECGPSKYKAKRVMVHIENAYVEPFNLDKEIELNRKYLEWVKLSKEHPNEDWSKHPGAPKKRESRMMKGEKMEPWYSRLQEAEVERMMSTINFKDRMDDLRNRRAHGIL